MKKISEHTPYVKYMKSDQLRELLRCEFEINNLPHIHKGTPLEALFNLTLQTLEQNGLDSPFTIFRTLSNWDTLSIESDFKDCCLQDLVMLTYFFFPQIDEADFDISLEEMSFPSGYKNRIAHLETSVYGDLLGFRRPTFNIQTKAELNQINPRKEKPTNYLIRFFFKKDTDSNHTYEQYTPKSNYKMNYLCNTLVSALVYCHKSDPFITHDIASFLNEHNLSSKKFINDFFLEKLGTDKEFDFAEIFNEEYKELYRKCVDEIFIPAAPIIKYRKSYSNDIESNNLKKFYKKLRNKIQKLSEDDLKYYSLDKDTKKKVALQHSKKEDYEIRFCKQSSYYIAEYLFGFRFCEKLVNFPNFFQNEQILKALHTLSEFPFCNSRIFFLELYARIHSNEYVYSETNFSTHDLWIQHLLEHMIYVWDKYMPALYYCFRYFYHMAHQSCPFPLDDYLAAKPEDLGFSIQKRIWKKAETISFFKMRKKEFLNPFILHTECSSTDYDEHDLRYLEATLHAIPKNLF